MGKEIQTVSKGAKVRTSAEAFFDKYRELEARLFLRLDPSGRKRSTTLKKLATGGLDLWSGNAFQTTTDQLKHTAFGELLKAAEQENSPEAFKQLLEVLLVFLGARPPQGVFTPTRSSGKRGRPITSQTVLIYSTWVSLGRPSLFTNQLAAKVFGPSFTKANGIDRRKMRDRCRRALQRYNNRLAKENALLGGTK